MRLDMRRVTQASSTPRPSRIGSSDPDEQELARVAALLPDPKPDDVLVERVWRKLRSANSAERRPSVAWKWAVASAAAVLLIAGGSALWFGRTSPQAEVMLAEGGVFAGARGASWVPARPGDPLRTGALLRSDASGRSVLRLPGVAALVLGTAADLTLEKLGRGTALRLDRGTVAARVTKRPRESPFSVRAGDFTVTVVGTIFSVTDNAGRVEVNVSEGVVEVAGRGDLWRVEAGHRWTSDSPGDQGEGSVPAASVALLLAAASTPPSPAVPELFQDLLRSEMQPRSPAPAAAPITTSAPPTVRIPTTNAVEPASPHAHVRVHPTPQPASSTDAEPPNLLARLDPPPAEPPMAPPVVLAPEAAAPADAPAPSVAPARAPERDYYAEALNLSRHGEHQKAAAVLEKALSASPGPHDLELYQLALLRQRHLNDPKGALDALLGYRKLYPRGSLRQEVDLSVVQVDRTLGRTEAALVESAHFLAQYPQSERADEVRVLRGDLLRQRGDCVAASSEYRAVTSGAALDDALYYAAYCRRELGESEKASAALRDYLVRFPSGRHADAAREALGQ
jgi:hypothetical protein